MRSQSRQTVLPALPSRTRVEQPVRAPRRGPQTPVTGEPNGGHLGEISAQQTPAPHCLLSRQALPASGRRHCMPRTLSSTQTCGASSDVRTGGGATAAAPVANRTANAKARHLTSAKPYPSWRSRRRQSPWLATSMRRPTKASVDLSVCSGPRQRSARLGPNICLLARSECQLLAHR